MSEYQPEADSVTPYSSNHSFDTKKPHRTIESFGYVSKSIVTLMHTFIGVGYGAEVGAFVGVGVGAIVGTGVGPLLGAGVGSIVVGGALGNSLGNVNLLGAWLCTGVGVTGGLIPPPGGKQHDINVTAPDPDILILICDTRR